MTSELELLNAIADADQKVTRTPATPAEIKAETLYYAVRGRKMTYSNAVAKMPKTAAASKWAAKLTAEFGPVR